MKLKHQRLLLICSVLIGLSIVASLTLTAFQNSLVFFYTPMDISHKKIHPEQRIRVGGLVKPQSLRHEGTSVYFTLMDQKETLEISYNGILPDLFREGQVVVAEGYLHHSHVFQAESVLAKHDENYMPKEVADRLKKEGYWRNAE